MQKKEKMPDSSHDRDKNVKAGNDEFIATAYLTLFGREADADGSAHYRQELESGRMTRIEMVRHMKNSHEGWLRLFPGEIPRLTVENDSLNDEEIRVGKSELRSRPTIFNIDLIGTCNMSPPCSMCINWNGDVGPRHHNGLTVADIERFGAHLQTAHEVINCGIGEPLLNRDLVPIIQLFHSWGKPFGFNSNGLALGPALVDRLAPYFEVLTIVFSLDAATAATYVKVRGRHFDQVVANIARYCARRREAAPEGLASRTGIVFMPMRCNRHETADFIRLGARLGVDVVELRALNQINKEWVAQRGDFTFDYNREILTPDELEEIRQQAVETARDEGIALECQYQASPESTFGFFNPAEYRDLPIRCVLPWRYILPYQNGDTQPCCFISESIGDWRQNGLEKLWNGPIMRKLRSQMADGGLPELCRRFPSCPVVQAYFREKQRQCLDLKQAASDSAPIRLPAPTGIAAMPQRKIPWLGRPIMALRRRFNLELHHSLGELLERQEVINRTLQSELEKLHKEMAELNRKTGEPRN
jgi:MoaA/NifB/PqqE/SkfB family radical SAM enzyme